MSRTSNGFEAEVASERGAANKCVWHLERQHLERHKVGEGHSLYALPRQLSHIAESEAGGGDLFGDGELVCGWRVGDVGVALH